MTEKVITKPALAGRKGMLDQFFWSSRNQFTRSGSVPDLVKRVSQNSVMRRRRGLHF